MKSSSWLGKVLSETKELWFHYLMENSLPYLVVSPSSSPQRVLGAITQHHKSSDQWELLLCHTALCHQCPRLLPLCPYSTCVSPKIQG